MYMGVYYGWACNGMWFGLSAHVDSSGLDGFVGGVNQFGWWRVGFKGKYDNGLVGGVCSVRGWVRNGIRIGEE